MCVRGGRGRAESGRVLFGSFSGCGGRCVAPSKGRRGGWGPCPGFRVVLGSFLTGVKIGEVVESRVE